MDLSGCTKEELIKELSARDSAPIEGEADLVFGTIGIDGGTEYVEFFKQVKCADDLPNLNSIGLRHRFNSHRSPKCFSFKTKEFSALDAELKRDNQAFAKWIYEDSNATFFHI